MNSTFSLKYKTLFRHLFLLNLVADSRHELGESTNTNTDTLLSTRPHKTSVNRSGD